MSLTDSISRKTSTRDSIRAAAEELFAAQGIEGVTTRALAKLAGVNMAAVNYHFGNKDNLTHKVFRDVARRTVKWRLDNMARITNLARQEGRLPRVEEVVEAFVDAYVNDHSPRTGLLLAHFVLQHRVRPTEWTRRIVHEELDGFALKYIELLRQAAPHLSEKETHWRYHLMVGAVMMSMSDLSHDGRMARLSGGLAHPEDRAEFKQQLVGFLVDSMGAGRATDKSDAGLT